jgi:hypothetical protein
MTLCASRYQAPLASSRTGRSTLRRMRSAFTLGPRTASSAGSTVSAASMSTATVATPPKPIERRKSSGNSIRLVSASATVMPETATVRPAVATVRATACSTVGWRRSSSRNLVTMNSP